MDMLEWLVWKGFDIKKIIIPCPLQRYLYKIEGENNVTVSNNDVDDD